METLGLAGWVVDACRRLRITEPTDIQRATIPLVLKGEDVAACAETGSGKTACFCLPILHHLSLDPYGVYALVLLPTRELAEQVAEQFVAFGSVAGLSVCLCIGGVDKIKQTKELVTRPHVVVGTPGRVADFATHPDPLVVRAFSNVKTLVLDEADRLLTANFEDDLLKIVAQLTTVANGRQTLLFSATLTDSVRGLRERLIKRREELAVLAGMSGGVKEMALVDHNPEEKPPPQSVLEHRYLFVPRHVKIAHLVHVLSATFGVEAKPQASDEGATKKPSSAVKSQGVVFVATCKMCQLVTVTLQLLGFAATGLHSLQNQKRRSATVGKMRAQRAAVLVATDVASRGLDLPKVGFVIHFDFPRTYQDYVHRVGRTARAKRKGVALAIVTEKDVEYVLEVEKRLGHKLEKQEVDEEAVMVELNVSGRAMLEASLMLHDTDFDELLADRKRKREAARRRRTNTAAT